MCQSTEPETVFYRDHGCVPICITLVCSRFMHFGGHRKVYTSEYAEKAYAKIRAKARAYFGFQGCDTPNQLELLAMKAASHHLGLSQKVRLEHTAKSTANGQLAQKCCRCLRGNNSPEQQVAVVCIQYSKKKNRTRTVAIQTLNKAALALGVLCLSSAIIS